MIYTKTGDKGTTSLVGGSRVEKDNVRVEAYGTVDELNSHIGLVAEMVKATEPGCYATLKRAQNKLFDIQTLLATEDEAIYAKLPKVEPSEVELLERAIDGLTDKLPKLKNFVIAGGNLVGAQCHVARTVCRRAERRVVSLAKESAVDAVAMSYLNRLSDYLFALGRWVVVSNGGEENLYIS